MSAPRMHQNQELPSDGCSGPQGPPQPYSSASGHMIVAVVPRSAAEGCDSTSEHVTGALPRHTCTKINRKDTVRPHMPKQRETDD